MQIRSARLADLAAIRDLVQRAYGPNVERIGRRPAPMDDDYAERVDQGHAFVADDAGVVGLIVLIHKADHVLIENVAVDPDRQGEGIGRALLAHAEMSARKSGTPTMRLYTNAKMIENLALYPHLGYQEVDRHSEDGFERVFFSKHLNSVATSSTPSLPSDAGRTSEPELLLRAAYDAFNTHDVEAVVTLMHPEVDWPNAWEGGRVVGREAVRDYWKRQFGAVSSKVEPQAFTEESDGSITVDVRQVIHDLSTGNLISDSRVRHRYRFAGGLITRMDVLELPGQS